MTSVTTPQDPNPFKNAGYYAIASGIIGIISFVFLITAVTTRTTWALGRFDSVYLLFKAHDVGLMIQFLLLIPVVTAIYKWSNLQPPGLSKKMQNLGVWSAIFTILFLVLGVSLLFSDGAYTVPQGIFGVWLLLLLGNYNFQISNGLRWFGRIVGVGLIIVGLFFPLYAIFVSTTILQIPAVDPSDPANFPDHFTFMNQNLHYLLDVGTALGVITLPFWTIIMGKKLLGFKKESTSSF